MGARGLVSGVVGWLGWRVRAQRWPVRARPSLEALEDRRVPTTLVLDFNGLGPGTPSFRSLFVKGAPAFLDMNGDRVVNGDDAAIAAVAVTHRVETALRASPGAGGPGLAVTDDLSDLFRKSDAGVPGAGRALIFLPGANATFLLHIAGDSHDLNVLGEARQAPVGTNVLADGSARSSPGNVYPATIMNLLSVVQQQLKKLGRSDQVSRKDFIDATARTALHEFGHLLGLGHPDEKVAHPLYLMDRLTFTAQGHVDPDNFRFLGRQVPVELYQVQGSKVVPVPSPPKKPTTQNPLGEFLTSLKGQTLLFFTQGSTQG